MEVLKRKSTLMAAVTLIAGAALGFGIATWTSRSEAASDKAVTKNDDRRSTITRTEDWDPFREMERMREEVDRAIRRATDTFRFDTGAAPFSRDLGYSSSLDVRDRGDHFEVRVYLPDAETKDVKVKTEGDQAVRVSVSHRKQQKRQDESGQAMFSELGRYEQLVTLPEPANTNDMKVDTRDNEVVITIPKKKTS
jgi:HSP20 family molecular chaperone IbpA